MGKEKWRSHIGLGALAGVVFGTALDFILPQFLANELWYNQQVRVLSGYPKDDYFPKSGGVYTVGVFPPILFGLIGTLIAVVIYKRKIARDKLGKPRASL